MPIPPPDHTIWDIWKALCDLIGGLGKIWEPLTSAFASIWGLFQKQRWLRYIAGLVLLASIGIITYRLGWLRWLTQPMPIGVTVLIVIGIIAGGVVTLKFLHRPLSAPMAKPFLHGFEGVLFVWEDGEFNPIPLCPKCRKFMDNKSDVMGVQDWKCLSCGTRKEWLAAIKHCRLVDAVTADYEKRKNEERLKQKGIM